MHFRLLQSAQTDSICDRSHVRMVAIPIPDVSSTGFDQFEQLSCDLLGKVPGHVWVQA